MIKAMVVSTSKLYQCLERDTSDLRHVGHARDAVDDGAENDWSDQNADGFDESITERLHASAEVGIKVSQRDADRHCDQHLKPQLQIPRLCLLSLRAAVLCSVCICCPVDRSLIPAEAIRLPQPLSEDSTGPWSFSRTRAGIADAFFSRKGSSSRAG